VARTTQRRQEAATPRQGRFGRGSSGQPQARRRFPRSAGQSAPRRRNRQPEQSGAQKLMQGIRGVLPGGGGKSSAGRRSGGSIPVVGGLLSSLGGTKKRGAGRGRKPAVFGLLGAGAAGAAAAVAKRRHGSRSPQPEGAPSAMSESEMTSTATPPPSPADAPAPAETAQRSVESSEDDVASGPDAPAEGEERG
jgi:hypothetical protein